MQKTLGILTLFISTAASAASLGLDVGISSASSGTHSTGGLLSHTSSFQQPSDPVGGGTGGIESAVRPSFSFSSAAETQLTHLTRFVDQLAHESQCLLSPPVSMAQQHTHNNAVIEGLLRRLCTQLKGLRATSKGEPIMVQIRPQVLSNLINVLDSVCPSSSASTVPASGAGSTATAENSETFGFNFLNLIPGVAIGNAIASAAGGGELTQDGIVYQHKTPTPEEPYKSLSEVAANTGVTDWSVSLIRTLPDQWFDVFFTLSRDQQNAILSAGDEAGIIDGMKRFAPRAVVSIPDPDISYGNTGGNMMLFSTGPETRSSEHLYGRR